MKIPQGMHSVTPHLVCAGAAKAIDFYKRAFGAKEMERATAPDGVSLMHAVLMIGDSVIMLHDEFPEAGGQSPLYSKRPYPRLHAAPHVYRQSSASPLPP